MLLEKMANDYASTKESKEQRERNDSGSVEIGWRNLERMLAWYGIQEPHFAKISPAISIHNRGFEETGNTETEDSGNPESKYWEK